MRQSRLIFAWALVLSLASALLSFPIVAEETTAEATSPATTAEDSLDLDFENPDTFIDQSEALGSKQYVRRAILSSVIKETSRFSFERMYLNHLMGFSAIFQRTRFAKYVTGCQEISVGYISQGGHGVEGGVELSGVSNIFAGYRYIWRPEKFSLWPFLGAGMGVEVGFLKLVDGPPEAQTYNGKKAMAFGTAGFLIPLVDVGIKVEVRGNFYGTDRLVLTSGVGAVLFL